MPRDIPVGNGKLLVCFDQNYSIRDLYFPHVLYRRSLLILSTQIDWKGGIVAANDSDIIHFARDTYSYVWPRDGALAANALDIAGYGVLAGSFYQFAADVIEEGGYFLHKYNPDGTLASSWHPWYKEGRAQLPIQEDETALVIWALWNHFVLYRDLEFVRPLYKPLIKKAGDFMCQYRDPERTFFSFSPDLEPFDICSDDSAYPPPARRDEDLCGLRFLSHRTKPERRLG